MTFQPGQFITAQRLNRLQPKTYWAAASGTVAPSATNADIPGVTMSITIDTNGATAAFHWTTAWYFTAVPSNSGSSRALWDVNVSPIVAVAQGTNTPDKTQGVQTWVTTIGTAGTYTFKVQTSTGTNTTTQIYSALQVTIYEVV